MSKRERRPNVYALLADRFDITHDRAKQLVHFYGYGGKLTRGDPEGFAEMLSTLTERIEQTGLVQTVDAVSDGNIRELRSCSWCEDFLEDDDDGDIVPGGNSELHPEVVCRRCRNRGIRL